MILVFGEMLIDMIENGNSYIPYPGGAPANFAVAAKRLGQRAGIMTSVGKEVFGEILVSHVKEQGIDTSLVKRSDKKTTLAFVKLKKGIPEFFFYRSADTDISTHEVTPDILEGVDHVHCGGFLLSELPVRDAQLKIMRLAKERGIKTSFCLNTRPDIWNNGLNKYLFETLELSDIVIASEEEFMIFSEGLTEKQTLDKFGIKRLVVTKGRGGSVMFTENEKIEHPIFDVDVADTTGAGDAFSAGIICGLCEGMEGKSLMEFATAVAAISITKKGAMSALPLRNEVTEFLEVRK